MKLCLAALTFVLLSQSALLAQGNSESKVKVNSLPLAEVAKMSPKNGDGFYWDYYIYIPQSLSKSRSKYLFVLPNNTGTSDDDIQVHERYAKKDITSFARLAEQLGVVLLEPVFPRERTNNRWKLYTHALDRDTLLTRDKKFRRLDLQLIAMIEAARRKLSGDGLQLDERVLMFGFSASGMFVNRFCLLHPDRVLAAAIGSPGGWAMLPIKSWNGQKLRYPIGMADFKRVVGHNFDWQTFKSLPLYFFIGDQDTNDSVVFRDGYDKQDERLIFRNFGSSYVERWRIAEKAYKEVGCSRCQFVIYKGVGHDINREIWKDIRAFFNNELNRSDAPPNNSLQPTPRRSSFINLEWSNRTLSLSARSG
jgi:pimeloyl-ACP methyl ester carboxylesterase